MEQVPRRYLVRRAHTVLEGGEVCPMPLKRRPIALGFRSPHRPILSAIDTRLGTGGELDAFSSG